MKRRSILLVEDESLVAIHEKHILEQNGYSVLVCSTGEEAVSTALGGAEIDLVLMDIDLGHGIDGTEAARRILEAKELPIVFLTAHAEQEYVDSVKKITRYGYVVKSAGEFVLVESVNMAFELFSAHVQLRTERNRARDYLEIAGVMIATFDLDGRVTMINRKGSELLGYPRERILGREWISSFVPASLKHRVAAVFDELRAGRTHAIEHFENFIVTSSGEERYISWSNILLRDEEGRIDGWISCGEDITELKRAEEQLAFQALLLDQIEDRVTATDLTGHITYLNKASYRTMGKEPADLRGHHVKEFGDDPKEGATQEEIVESTLREGRWHGEVVNISADGSRTVYDSRTTLVYDQDGTPVGMLGISTDITDRRKAQEELREALERKERLMAEVHHRVKNNLAMVSSLISLKNDSLHGIADLTDLRSQVNAIQTVHEQLQYAASATDIPIRRYLIDLLEAVFTYTSGPAVAVAVDGADISVPTGAATTIGLIANELATNAVKHGFENIEEPKFSVVMDTNSATAEYVLTFSNNGPPIPEDISLENERTLGFRLIHALVAQLKGSISVQRSPHPRFELRGTF